MSFMAIKASKSHRRRVLTVEEDADWWTSGGAPTPWAAYQPKGAASLAASYTDLSGNGNNAGVGVAPTWDATNGWKFDRSNSEYLTTTFTPTAGSDQTQAVIIQFTNCGLNANTVIAGGLNNGQTRGFLIQGNSGGVTKYWNGLSQPGAAQRASGNVAISGNQGYYNRAADGANIATGTGPFGNVYIGAAHRFGVGAALFETVYIQALAIYDVTLAAGQVSAVATAMAAL